jgi:hypothetical protein
MASAASNRQVRPSGAAPCVALWLGADKTLEQPDAFSPMASGARRPVNVHFLPPLATLMSFRTATTGSGQRPLPINHPLRTLTIPIPLHRNPTQRPLNLT